MVRRLTVILVLLAGASPWLTAVEDRERRLSVTLGITWRSGAWTLALGALWGSVTSTVSTSTNDDFGVTAGGAVGPEIGFCFYSRGAVPFVRFRATGFVAGDTLPVQYSAGLGFAWGRGEHAFFFDIDAGIGAYFIGALAGYRWAFGSGSPSQRAKGWYEEDEVPLAQSLRGWVSLADVAVPALKRKD